MMNRRLFRPGLPEQKEQLPGRTIHGLAPNKKPAPPEQTHAENFYWVKQMQAHTPMTIILMDGEALHGTVEWYDRDCIKLTRSGSPNLMIFKKAIKYVFKEGEDGSSNGNRD
jgi:host factor-I protein